MGSMRLGIVFPDFIVIRLTNVSDFTHTQANLVNAYEPFSEAPLRRNSPTPKPNPDTPNRRVTIQDVAHATGVSIGTVSRALNNRAGVHPNTRRNVLEAAATLGFEADRAARELSVRRPISVGLTVAHGYRRLTPFFVLFSERLHAHLGRSGLRLDDILSGPDGLPVRDAGAFVLLGAHPDDPRLVHLQKLGRPFVLVGHHEGVRCITSDDEQGGRLAAEHLLRLGHHEFLHLRSDPHGQASADRAHGFHTALAAASNRAAHTLISDDSSALSAYRALRRHFETLRHHAAPLPTAIFAGSDELACGCLAAASDLGLRVPFDLSLIGFDDLPEIGEGLTTIHQDFDALAQGTLTLLHEAIDAQPVRSIRLSVTLQSRGTTAERR